jgi:hypothetical protein
LPNKGNLRIIAGQAGADAAIEQQVQNSLNDAINTVKSKYDLPWTGRHSRPD